MRADRSDVLVRNGSRRLYDREHPVPRRARSRSKLWRLSGPRHATTPISLDDRLLEVETNLIGWALKASGGNKSRAAELLQIKRSTLGDRINRCGLGDKASHESEDDPERESVQTAHA